MTIRSTTVEPRRPTRVTPGRSPSTRASRRPRNLGLHHNAQDLAVELGHVHVHQFRFHLPREEEEGAVQRERVCAEYCSAHIAQGRHFRSNCDSHKRESHNPYRDTWRPPEHSCDMPSPSSPRQSPQNSRLHVTHENSASGCLRSLGSSRAQTFGAFGPSPPGAPLAAGAEACPRSEGAPAIPRLSPGLWVSALALLPGVLHSSPGLWMSA